MGPRKLLQASNNRFLKKTNAERHAHTSPKHFLSLPSAIVAQVTQRFGMPPYIKHVPYMVQLKCFSQCFLLQGCGFN